MAASDNRIKASRSPISSLARVVTLQKPSSTFGSFYYFFLIAAMAIEQSDEKDFCSTISLSGDFQPLKELGSHVLDLLSTSIQVHRETNLRDLN